MCGVKSCRKGLNGAKICEKVGIRCLDVGECRDTLNKKVVVQKVAFLSIFCAVQKVKMTTFLRYA